MVAICRREGPRVLKELGKILEILVPASACLAASSAIA
jgi:hypothetical protein